MSDTPRTDEECFNFAPVQWPNGRIEMSHMFLPSGEYISCNFARQLERELAEARAELKRKDEALKASHHYIAMTAGSGVLLSLVSAALAQGGKEST